MRSFLYEIFLFMAFPILMYAETPALNSPGDEKATFGAGCFWCVEAIFLDLHGVSRVVSGYSGGTRVNPTYQEVCQGTTGHAEVVQVYFDPQTISYEELLEVFWSTHDPTTLDRQGNDVGPQYRSVIFYHDERQKELAQYYLRKLEESEAFDDPVVTAIEPYRNFYKAEDYHQNYYNLNPQLPYCRIVIQPKLEKFRKVFADKLKKNDIHDQDRR